MVGLPIPRQPHRPIRLPQLLGDMQPHHFRCSNNKRQKEAYSYISPLWSEKKTGGDNVFRCFHNKDFSVIKVFVFQKIEEGFFVLYVPSKPHENYRMDAPSLRFCNVEIFPGNAQYPSHSENTGWTRRSRIARLANVL